MNKELEDACSRVGWEQLYNPFFPQGLRQPSANGEVYMKSPFPFSNDNRASFELNVRTGLWRDWHAEHIIRVKGGNFVQFVALMNARIGADGVPQPDYTGTERALRVQMRLSTPIDPGWLAATQANLANHESRGHQLWIGRKPWYRETLTRLGIGYDENKNRLVLPLHEPDGRIANAKLYRPGADVKMLWEAVGLGGNFVFPHCAWNEQWVILVEGEPDAITLRCMGYNAMCGTMGSGKPVPEGNWWIGKQVFVWMDGDAAGREAEQNAVHILRNGAADLRVVTQPTWEGAPSNSDPSDWIMHLFRQGLQYDQVQREITRVLGECRVATREVSLFETEPVDVLFHEALTARNAGQRLRFHGHIVGRSDTIYATPLLVDGTCPGTGYTMCRSCPMHTQHHGNATFTFDQRSPLVMKTIMVSEERRDAAIKEHLHIPTRCQYIRLDIRESADIGVAILTNTIDETRTTNSSFADKKKYEAIVLLTGERPDIHPNIDYNITAFVRTMPASAKQVMVIDTFEPTQSILTKFRMDEDNRRVLESFIPTTTVQNALVDVAGDVSAAFTRIRQRQDLHLLMRSVWHSITAFQFAGAIHNRGWLEAIIVGDTRCGKSQTFTEMAKMYGSGILVDNKMQTPVGLLASVEQSAITGERYVVPGLFPQQDATGPICLDEYSLDRYNRGLNVMDFLSSTRASGQVVITKAAQAVFSARVRLMLMANPGLGRFMRDIGGYGSEIIRRLIPQPEDIARFDIAMCVAQEDVEPWVMNDITPPKSPNWSAEAHRTLLAWTWSRTPDQVVWDAGAEQAVIEMSTHMVARYDSELPIVEPSDQRMRIAKLAVSVAAQCFSSDPSGETVIVKTEHVLMAASMFVTWYDKPSFAYNLYSERLRSERCILNPQQVWEMLDRVFGDNQVVLAQRLIRLSQFTEKTFSTVIPIRFVDVHVTMQTLSINRCIREVTQGRDMFELTPAFVKMLETYIEAKTRGGNQ